MSDTEKYLSWVLKGGLLLTPFLVLVVTRALYFPFITGKNFAFRILIEVLAVVWVWAALRYPSLRPRSTWIAWAMVAFIAVMAIATIFSISPYRSFWSNFERMEGYLGLLHLALYFLLLGTVFKTEGDWKLFFHTSLAASVIVSLYAVFQIAGRVAIHQGGTRLDATLGNATYLAAYLLFHLFFLVWFLLRARDRWMRIGYGAVFLLEAFILYHTATRGAMLGFLGGLALFAAFLAVTNRGLLRRAALGAIGVVVLLPVLFFLVKDAGFVKRSDVLSRFAAISPTEITTQSRFTIWRMAFDGWRERPIIGWGQESFTYVFSKYYEPSLWRQEPWFDRAHNVFLDWLIAGGALGLAAYLSIYAATGWTIARLFRRNAIDSITAGAFGALLAAHFFQNLFVFDNLTSYILFAAVLAYLHSASLRATPGETEAGSKKRRQPAMPVSAAAMGTATAGVLILIILYFANIKPIQASAGVLKGLSAIQTHEAAGKVDAALAAFGSNIARGTFGTMELREQLAQNAPAIARDPGLAAQDKAKFFELAVTEMEAERSAFPSNMRAKAFLATLYLVAGRPQDALAAVDQALAVSQNRQQFYFIAAEAYLNAGDQERSIEAVRRAYDLAPEYPEAIANLATVYIVTGRDAEATALFQKHFGKPLVAEQRYAQLFVQRGRLDIAGRIWEELIAREPLNAEYRMSIGIVYARTGRTKEAIAAIEEAIRLEPRFRAQGEAIIQTIRSGRTP